MMGFGDSEEEAIASLHTTFEARKASREPLPRPGRLVLIEDMPSPRIAEHPDLLADFLRRIFHLDSRNNWLSDEAGLRCLHDEATNDRFVEKILLTYEVDVSDIADGPLAAILERIVARGAWPP